MRGQAARTALPVLLLLIVIGGASLLPILRLLAMAVAPAGSIDFSPLLKLFARATVIRATLNTLDTSVFGMVVAVLIGGPAALLVSMTDLPCRRALGFLLLIPLMVAPQITALSWAHLLGPSSTLLNLFGIAPPAGAGNPLLGRGGIILLYGVQEAPIVFVTLRAGLAGIPRDFIEAARGSGAYPLRALFDIVLPLMRPYLVAGAALAFVGCVGNFGIPALLGLPVGYLTLSTLIYQQLSSMGPEVLPQVAGLSVVVGVLALAGVGVQFLALSGRSRQFATAAPARLELGRWRLPVAVLVGLFLLVMIVLPVAGLVGTALIPAYGVPLTPATLTFDNFAEVLLRQASTVRALSNSTWLAGGAALILAALAIPLAVAADPLPRAARRAVQGVADLSYALPGVALSIAVILLFLRPLPLIGSLYATASIILVAYLMRFLPLALKPVATAVNQIPSDLIEAAASSGAGPLRRLMTITAPLAAPSAIAGALLVFMSAFSELTVSALLWSGGHETVGVILFSLEGAGLATQAAAVAVTTIVVVVVLLLAVDRLGRRLPAGVLPWR